MPSGSLAFWASALHGMGYHSIPTRRASLISATTGQMGLTIRRRMVPRSPSSALPISGEARRRQPTDRDARRHGWGDVHPEHRLPMALPSEGSSAVQHGAPLLRLVA